MAIIGIVQIFFILLHSLPYSILTGMNASLPSPRQPRIATLQSLSNSSLRNGASTPKTPRTSANVHSKSIVAPTSTVTVDLAPIYIKDKAPKYVKSSITDGKKPITFTTQNLTTKMPAYIKDNPPIFVKNKSSTNVKKTPAITFMKEKLTTKAPTYKAGDSTISWKGNPPMKKQPATSIKERITTTTPTYNKDKKTTKGKDGKYPYDNDKEEKIPIFLLPPKCPNYASCKDRCSFKRQYGEKGSCFCDPDCDFFKDCCADFDLFCDVALMLKRSVESVFKVRLNCTTLHQDHSPIWVIDQCQPDWNDVHVLRRCVKENMNSISELIPVTDRDNNTFLNRYCAICNNVTQFSQWEFEVFCDVIPPAGYTEEQWATFLDLFCPKNSLNLTQTWGRRYCVDVQSNCSNWDNDEEVRRCEFGLTGLITDENFVHYRNWDCFLCNYDGNPRVSCGPKYPITTIWKPKTISYSSIFRASSSPIPQSRCPKNHIYDDTSRECEPLLARSDLNFGDVLKKYAIILEYHEHSDSCGISLSTGLESIKLITRLKYVFRSLLEINLMLRDSKFMGLDIQPIGNFSYRVMFEMLETLEENELIEDNIGLELGIQDIAFDLHVRNFTRRHCVYSMNRSIVRKMSCAENETFSMNEVQIYANKSALIIKSGKVYTVQDYLVLKGQKRLALCKDYWPGNCSFYKVENKSDWSIFKNGSVYTDMTKVAWLHYGEYSIVDGAFRFCSQNPEAEFTRLSSTSIHETILTHATTACLSISVVSLAVLLIVYFQFPTLRNLPGKNLMLFSFILAFSQLLWLLQQYIASLSSTFCLVIAFALQYFLLASFSCSTSIGFHSLMTFLNIAKGKLRQSSGRNFLFYVLYSLGFPLLLLLACWLLYYNNIITVVHHQHACWFKHDLSQYVAFYIPAFAMFFPNFVLLLKTMMLLRDCTNERRNLAKENGAPTSIQIGIYLRMSTIMGATWLFGVFIVIFPDAVVFEYLFVFINGCQGLYVALAFLFTENVKKIFLRRNDRGTTTWKTNTSRGRSIYSTTTM